MECLVNKGKVKSNSFNIKMFPNPCVTYTGKELEHIRDEIMSSLEEDDLIFPCSPDDEYLCYEVGGCDLYNSQIDMEDLIVWRIGKENFRKGNFSLWEIFNKSYPHMVHYHYVIRGFYMRVNWEWNTDYDPTKPFWIEN